MVWGRHGRPSRLAFVWPSRLSWEFCGRGKYFADDVFDVVFAGSMVDDAGAQSEVAVNGRIGDVDAAPADNAIENAAVEGIEIAGVADVAEANGTECDRGEEF